MRNALAIALTPILLCIAGWAQEVKVLSMCSPKLRQFLSSHPEAFQAFTNTLSRAFGHRPIEIYYFYSEDKSVPVASHYYLEEGGVGIKIRENQTPSDEFICLLFEVINSESEEYFKELITKARAGTVSRRDFAEEMLRTEFKAVEKTRGLLPHLNLSKQELADSHEYKQLINCPKEFKEFLTYTRKITSPHRDAIKVYESAYDLLRKPQR